MSTSDRENPSIPSSTLPPTDHIISLHTAQPSSTSPSTHFLLYISSQDDRPPSQTLPERSKDPKDAGNETETAIPHLRELALTNPPPTLLTAFNPQESSFFNLSISPQHHLEKGTENEQKQAAELHIILSLGSGAQQASTLHAKLIQPLLNRLFPHKDHNNQPKIHTTTSADSITSLAKSTFLPAARAGRPTSIILVSGDGGVVDLLNALLPSPSSSYSPGKAEPIRVRPRVALIPAGTGNALAHSSLLASDATRGLRAALLGTPTRLPVFSVTFSLPASPHDPQRSEDQDSSSSSDDDSTRAKVAQANGAVVFSFGLHAALVADSDTPAYRRHGAVRFQMAAKENLFPADGSGTHPYLGELVLLLRDGTRKVVERRSHNYILATLCSNLEKGFTVSPRSRPLDGKLRVVHFGGRSGEEVMRVMSKAYDDGKHVYEPGVGYESVRGLELRILEEGDVRYRRVCIDGKIYVAEPGTRITVQERLEDSPLDLVWLDRRSSEPP